MDKHGLLPFKVGQLAEARSFISGFRSAWFRCKIKEISWRKVHIGHTLEYFDFPDEKVKWTKLYQVPYFYDKKSKVRKRQLMERPCYPTVYHESEMPHISAISEVAVIIDGVWKVGDLIDWWTDGCYWSGTITQVLGNDRVQIELPLPPEGEGGTYEVSCKDLRPSLDWSPDFGWTLLTSERGENCRRCARIIQPNNQVAGGGLAVTDTPEEGTKHVEATAGSSFNSSLSSHRSVKKLPVPEKLKRSRTGDLLTQPLSRSIPKEAMLTSVTNKGFAVADSGIGKPSFSDGVSSSHVRGASARVAGKNSGEDLHCRSDSPKKFTGSEGLPLNITHSDTLEATIFDLEELVNKINWMKGSLEFGIRSSKATRPSWKFVEPRASSTPK